MRRILLIGAILISFVFLVVFFIGNKTQIVDVRTVEEYKAGHLSGAVNVPLSDIQKGDLSKLDKDAFIKLYCRSGRRAFEAKLILDKSGYKNVINIGGISDLQEKGNIVCKSDKPDC